MFEIRFKKKAYKELLSLPSLMIRKVVVAIDDLAINPRPEGSKKLKGSNENLWRIRIGSYRVIIVSKKPLKLLK